MMKKRQETTLELCTTAITYKGNETPENFSGGDGNSADTAFVIATPGQLRKLIIESNCSSLKGKYFSLEADFRIETDLWIPIGSKPNCPFRGIFNGNGHTICGTLDAGDNGQKYFGFFGQLDEACIKNLQLSIILNNTAPTNAYYYTGGIAGYSNTSSICQCTTSGCIEVATNGSTYTGGIVGMNYKNSQIVECTNKAKITGDGMHNNYTGGIAGDNAGNSLISQCDNEGRVTSINDSLVAENEAHTGGIAGRNYNNSRIEHCINAAKINGQSDITFSYTGGIVGKNTYYSTVFQCRNLKANIEGTGGIAYTGGIIGNNDTGGVADHCDNSGDVSGSGQNSSSTGGIAGFNLGSEIYACCQNTGEVNRKKPDEKNDFLRAGNNTQFLPCPNRHRIK